MKKTNNNLDIDTPIRYNEMYPDISQLEEKIKSLLASKGYNKSEIHFRNPLWGRVDFNKRKMRLP